MFKTSPKRNKPLIASKSAFTLIELLVVIAIIAILASILFPVFGRARENARRSTCQSNLKQMALAVAQYEQDYDERFPIVVNTNPAVPPPYGWADIIQPYTKSIQIYHCPSDKQDQQPNPALKGYCDYYMNAALGNVGGYYATRDYRHGGIALAAVENVSLTILHVDGDGTSGNSTAAYRGNGYSTQGDNSNAPPLPAAAGGGLVSSGAIYQKHLEGTNLSFVDGHVKWYKTNDSTATIKSSFYNAGTPFSTSLNNPTFATSTAAAINVS